MNAKPEPVRWEALEPWLDRLFALDPGDRSTCFTEILDPKLRAEIERLVQAAENDRVLTPPTADADLLDELFIEDQEAERDTTEIGPYRLVSLIGRGGMGEVYEAEDTRLGRRVAIKLLRDRIPAAERTPAVLLREARAASALDHPHIGTVHDIGEVDGTPYLVMALYRGATLAERISAGPLPVDSARRIAAEIASALAAAHGAGLVHRDLKPANVLLTERDEVKLVDFGIARREDETTQGAGQFCGTPAYASPEQLAGRPLDGRSDLWSLGVVLYEMLAGRRPFADASQVSEEEPEPLERWRPEVPAALARTVHRLLAKEPRDRPCDAASVAAELAESSQRSPGERRWLAIAAGITAAVAALVLTALWWRPVTKEPDRYVAVLAPQVTAPEGMDAPLLAGVVSTAAQSWLASHEGLAPVSVEGLDPAPRSPLEAARAVAADEWLAARLDCWQGRCQLTLGRHQVADGRVTWIDRQELPADDLQLLAAAVVARLQDGYRDPPPRAGASGRGPLALPAASFDQYQRLVLRATTAPGDLDAEDLLPEIEALRRISPEVPELAVLEARTARRAFYWSRRPELFERALGLLSEARRLAPRDPAVLAQLFDLAKEGGRWPLAEEALAALAEAVPGEPAVLERQAELLAHQGRKIEALDSMRRAARLRPAADRLISLALLEYQLGEIAAARGTLDQLLARAPESVRARSLLAQFELVDGSVERAAQLYRELAAESDGLLEISNLAFAETLLGDFAAAAASYRQAFDREPDNAFVRFNLADALKLAGDSTAAREHYEQVLADLARRPQEPAWQTATVRAQALAHLGREREAVAAVQEALQQAPDNPQVAFEAAVVYALLELDTPALVNAEKALAAGISPRWLALPWFDRLRRLPAFTALEAG